MSHLNKNVTNKNYKELIKNLMNSKIEEKKKDIESGVLRLTKSTDRAIIFAKENIRKLDDISKFTNILTDMNIMKLVLKKYIDDEEIDLENLRNVFSEIPQILKMFDDFCNFDDDDESNVDRNDEDQINNDGLNRMKKINISQEEDDNNMNRFDREIFKNFEYNFNNQPFNNSVNDITEKLRLNLEKAASQRMYDRVFKNMEYEEDYGDIFDEVKTANNMVSQKTTKSMASQYESKINDNGHVWDFVEADNKSKDYSSERNIVNNINEIYMSEEQARIFLRDKYGKEIPSNSTPFKYATKFNYDYLYTTREFIKIFNDNKIVIVKEGSKFDPDKLKNSYESRRNKMIDSYNRNVSASFGKVRRKDNKSSPQIYSTQYRTEKDFSDGNFSNFNTKYDNGSTRYNVQKLC